jgi:hypothetical protein
VNESAELLGQLDIFYINDIMKFDFELSELEWNDKKELGSGSFAKVYTSKLTRKNRPVAIKVCMWQYFILLLVEYYNKINKA